MSTAALPRVTVVVAKHRDAVPLFAGQRAVAIGVICSEEDGKEGRAALDRALAEAEGRGCRVAHARRTLGGQQGRGRESLLEEFRELRPQQYRTLTRSGRRTTRAPACPRTTYRPATPARPSTRSRPPVTTNPPRGSRSSSNAAGPVRTSGATSPLRCATRRR